MVCVTALLQLCSRLPASNMGMVREAGKDPFSLALSLSQTLSLSTTLAKPFLFPVSNSKC